MNKSSAKIKYDVQIYLGLIDVGFHNYMQVVLQNTSNNPVFISEGVAVAQLLVIPCEIPTFEIGWEETESRNGSFGSTGQCFEKVIPVNTISSEYVQIDESDHKINKAFNALNPSFISLNEI